jgi:hypothetical protein
LSCACLPHSTNTTGSSRLLMMRMTESVNVCQPLFLCEFAFADSTVRTVLTEGASNRECSSALIW